MTKGPSPLIPLLLVVTLGLLLRGNSFPASLELPLVSDAEHAVFMAIVIIPFLLFLALYSARYTIVIPLATILVTYTVSTMLLGPLMLILVIYLASDHLPAFKSNSEDLGWGCLLLVGFLLLQWILSEEGRQSGALIVALVVLICYSFRS